MKSETIALAGEALESLGRDTRRRGQDVEARLFRSRAARSGILDGIENRLQMLCAAARGAPAASLFRTTRKTAIDHHTAKTKPAPNSRSLRSVAVIGALLLVAGLSGWGTAALVRFVNYGTELTGTPAVDALVDRIINVESKNRFNATNKNSSALGLGQFIEATWLDLIRAHRPELASVRTKAETLDLRGEPTLAREITRRYVERNAALLRKRGLPVSPSTVYLAHFAGGAGAVAILRADESADAATVMAKADATGKIKRDRLIKANPFLLYFSVGDLKLWAERKMHGPALDLAKLSGSGARN
jgi:hypothetical protein